MSSSLLWYLLIDLGEVQFRVWRAFLFVLSACICMYLFNETEFLYLSLIAVFSHINACLVFILNEFKGLTFVNFAINLSLILLG